MFTARRPRSSIRPLSSLLEPMGTPMMPLGGFPGFGMMDDERQAFSSLFDGLEGLHSSPATVQSRTVSRDGNTVTTTTRTFGRPTVHIHTSISSPQRRTRRPPSHRGAFGSSLFPGISDSDGEDSDDDIPMWVQQPRVRSRVPSASPSSHVADMMAAMTAMADDFAGMAALPSFMGGGLGPSLMPNFPSSFGQGPATTRAATRPSTASRARSARRSGPRADEGEEAVQEMSCRVVNKDPEHRCPVCLEDVEVDEPVRALVCGHTIHHLCLKRAFQQKIERDGPSDLGWQCIVCRHALK